MDELTRAKKAYMAPKLTTYGPLKELVQGGTQDKQEDKGKACNPGSDIKKVRCT